MRNDFGREGSASALLESMVAGCRASWSPRSPPVAIAASLAFDVLIRVLVLVVKCDVGLLSRLLQLTCLVP